MICIYFFYKICVIVIIEVNNLKKIQNFIKTRSKILFFSSIISIILFVLIIPEFLHYSDFVNSIINDNNIKVEITQATMGEVIWNTHATEAFEEFSLIFCCIFVFISLFNLVGYIYNKSEFIFICIGLGVVVTCMSIYVASPIYIFLVLLSTILNLIGYFEQNSINKR